MLTTEQKAAILAKVGIAVPRPPLPCVALLSQALSPYLKKSLEAPDMNVDHDAAMERWRNAVDILYVEYAVARAAKSLREADEADRFRRLQAANAGHTRSVQGHAVVKG